MVKTRRNVWNTMVQEEQGQSSGVDKDPGEDKSHAEVLQQQGDMRNGSDDRNRGARNHASQYNRSSMEDILFIHPNDHAKLQLVAVQLTGNNYYTWSRSVKRALGARNKLDLINGNLLEPPVDSYFHKSWLKAYYMVSIWLMNSMVKELASSFQYIDDSRTLWEEIRNRFDRSSGPKLYQLERDLSQCVQNNSSVMEYFNNLNAIWDEINVLEPVPICSCVVCECGAAQAMRQLVEKRRLNQFLLGLNDSFETARSQILLSEPLPTVSRAYSLILQDEDQRRVTSKLSHVTESALLAKSAQTGGFQRNNAGYSIPRLTKEERKKLFCKHCGMNGHEANGCFKLHGIPEWYRLYKEERNMIQAHCVTEYGASGSVGPGYRMEQLVKEEVQKCMSQIQQTGKQSGQEDRINLVNSDPLVAFDRHFAFGVINDVGSHQWILDSGASTHICCNQNLLKDIRRLDKDQKVYLPDGSVQLIQFVGEVRLTDSIRLKNVLLAPSFTHNLVSVAELAKQLGVKCTFIDTHCLIQKQKGDAVLGIAQAAGKLYIFNAEHGILHQTSCVYTPQQNGVMERKHRSLLQVARAVMFQSKLLSSFWPYSILYATWLINRVPSVVLNWKSPYEVLFKESVDVTTIQPFGSLVYAVDTTPSRGKFDARGNKCVFLGFAQGSKACTLFDMITHKVIVSRDVQFFGSNFPYAESDLSVLSSDQKNYPDVFIEGSPTYLPRTTDSDTASKVPSLIEKDTADKFEDPIPNATVSVDSPFIEVHTEPETSNSEQVLGRQKRTIKAPAWTKDFVAYVDKLSSSINDVTQLLTPCTFPYIVSPVFLPDNVALLARVSELKEPATYKEASSKPEWIEAMRLELDELACHHVRDLYRSGFFYLRCTFPLPCSLLMPFLSACLDRV